MLFLDFKEKMYELVCFSVHQIYNWQPDFNSNNLTRWTEKGYIIKLRNGFYSFPEFINMPGAGLYIANRIYKPSYISLHYALNFYGIIPESVVIITSVSSLKTNTFKNPFGTYSYQSIKPALLFGYDEKPFQNITVKFASSEKAILDLLYLYPFYSSEKDLKQLRLDSSILENNINRETLHNYLDQFKSIALENRINLLMKVYAL
jgi:predicted transcriptional regulator of viral defense system